MEVLKTTNTLKKVLNVKLNKYSGLNLLKLLSLCVCVSVLLAHSRAGLTPDPLPLPPQPLFQKLIGHFKRCHCIIGGSPVS